MDSKPEFVEAKPPVEKVNRATEFVENIYHGSQAQATIHVQVGETRQNPLQSPGQQEKTLILESSKKEGERIIAVNPCHGNEPYILGVNVALSVNKVLKEAGQNKARIVVPLLYPGRQEQILKENFSANSDEIFLDERLGNFYKEVLFRNGRFDEHLASLVINQERVQDLIRDYLSGTLTVKSLATGEVKEFSGRDITLDINAGSRFPISPDSYYVFPMLLSELLEEVGKTDLSFDHQQLTLVQRQAQDRENAYRAKFIPHIHTFSFKEEDYPKEGKTFTPPLKHPVVLPPEVDSQAIYVMTSGTGSEVPIVYKNARELGLEVYRPPFIDLDYGRAALPDVIYHPNIVAVFGRMGWGTGWICQQAEKPFIVVPYNFPDDPEIYFNIKTLRDKRLGVVYERQEDIVKQALALVGDIRQLNESIFHKYGTRDGIDFVARKIVEDLHQRRKELSDRLKPQN